MLFIAPIFAAFVGWALGPGLIHPANLNPMRLEQTKEILDRTQAMKENFVVRAWVACLD
jgi:hypothetical protein